jgi:hypothetical protein
MTSIIQTCEVIDLRSAFPIVPQDPRSRAVQSACRCSVRRFGAIYLPLVEGRVVMSASRIRRTIDQLYHIGAIDPSIDLFDEFPPDGDDLFEEPDPTPAEQWEIAQRTAVVRSLKLRWYPDFVPLDAIDAAFGRSSSYTRKRKQRYRRAVAQ